MIEGASSSLSARRIYRRRLLQKTCAHRFKDGGSAPAELHKTCAAPRWRSCGRCGLTVTARCRSTRRRVCGSCAESHRKAVYQVALSGFLIASRGQAVFLTLTAPGAQPHIDTTTGKVCPCTPDGGVQPAVFNAALPRRWNRFSQSLRRLIGGRVAYFRTIETQARGALHEHVLMFPTDAGRKLLLDVAKVRALAMAHGYGHAVKVRVVSSVGGAASYVAKYVSKSCDERAEVPWMPDASTGELVRAAYRPWSASRDWGVRMAQIVDAQRQWARARDRAAVALDNNTESYTGTLEIKSDEVRFEEARRVIEEAFGACEVIE